MATTSGDAIRHLWTHKTQDHPWLADEDLVIERAEGVWVWTERGKKLLDGFAGLAVVNVGHGRREIAEAIAEHEAYICTETLAVELRRGSAPANWTASEADLEMARVAVAMSRA